MRRAGTALLLGGTALAVCLAALGTGDYPVTPGQVLGALLGRDPGLPATVVTQWRLPRVAAALAFGAALGVSGALFQVLTRNPLGSPDVIGFSTGSYTGALVVLLVLGGGVAGVSVGALVGGLATAGLVWGLARQDRVGGLRLVLVGIGVSALLAAVNHYLLLHADIQSAMGAAIWGAGSLNGLRWPTAAPAIAGVLVVLACTVPLARHVAQLELGTDLAAAIGVRVGLVRQLSLLVGVALTATATAVAGPIAFVSLAAPQLARRLLRTPGHTLWGAALVGAVLLPAADLFGQRIVAPVQLPVGIVTASLGGCYLAWLLFKEVKAA